MLSSLKQYWQSRPTETAFVLMAVCFGLLFVFLTPPTQSADETTHFYRTYEFSIGHLLARPMDAGYGDWLPAEVVTTTRQLFADIPSHYERKFRYRQIPGLFKRKIDSHQLMPVHFEGDAVYTPAAYLPQLVAVTIAKLIWPSTIFMYYLGRITNLAAWIGLTLTALRLWPANKWPIFAIALLPMSLSQAASFSTDATINSLAFLIISGAFYYSRRRRALTRLELGLAFGAVCLLALSKPVFFVFSLLILLFKPLQLGGKKTSRLIKSVFLLVPFGLSVIWSQKAKPYVAGMQHYYLPGQHINQTEQIKFSLAHPLHSLAVMVNTYLSSLGNILAKSFVGRLGWWEIDLPVWLIIATYVLLATAITHSEPADQKFFAKERLISGTTWLLCFLMISAVLYATYSVVGSKSIYGLQGRYFIPLTPLVIPLLTGYVTVPNWNRLAKWLFPIGYSLILIISLVVMVNRFI